MTKTEVEPQRMYVPVMTYAREYVFPEYVRLSFGPKPEETKSLYLLGKNSCWIIKEEILQDQTPVGVRLERLTYPGKGDSKIITMEELAANFVRAVFAE